MDKEMITEKEQVMEKETKEFEEVEVFQEVKTIKKEVRTDSYFDGSLIELIGWRLLAFLITIVTFGIAAPWGKCMLYAYQIKHTVYNGKRLKFEGTGGDLFVNKFKWALLTIITLGIYALFIPIKKTKWVISNIHFEDEEFIKEESFFDGKTIQLIGINLLCNILNIISFGLLYPFTVCLKLRWINKHTVINRKKLAFNGKAICLFGKFILWNFLTLITLGIYGLWLPIKILKWKTKNTHIKVVGEVEEKDKSALIAIPIAILAIILMISIFPIIIQEMDISENIFKDLSLNGFFDNSSMQMNGVNSVSETSKKSTSSSKTTNKKSNSTSAATINTTKKSNYPTLKEIDGDYGINITEKHFVNGVVDKSKTQEASGIETFERSGQKIKYLSYTMNYNETDGYAYYIGNKCKIEGYFTYKNGRVRAELKEYIYEDNGSVIKIERIITGNKIS